MEWPGQKRVLILDAGPCGKQGAIRGDVLTHINMQTIDEFVREWRVNHDDNSSSTTNDNDHLNNSSNNHHTRDTSFFFSNDNDSTADTAQSDAELVENCLLRMLQKQKEAMQSGQGEVERIMVTLNAERSVAEALKRRALTIDEAEKNRIHE